MQTTPEMMRAYNVQRKNAARRRIAWLFTIDTWIAWWAEDDRWARRGVHRGEIGMCRFGDTGPYSHDNVFPGRPVDNARDRAPSDRREAARKAWATQRARGQRSHLVDRDGHPRNRRVMTPMGEFPSAAQAALHYGRTRQRIGQLCRAGVDGWRYL